MSAADRLDAAPNLNAIWAGLLVEALVREGVTAFFVAPGSRSTPLTIAAAQHPEALVVLHPDERGTSFAALGHARVAGQPAAWITTSGTAVANGLPAVVEASRDGVPIVLLTADRPPELRGTGANQTIDQVEIFGSAVRFFVDLPAPDAQIPARYVPAIVAEALARARRTPRGPVHFNVMLREPLAPEPRAAHEPGGVPSGYLGEPRLAAWLRGKAPFTEHIRPPAAPPERSVMAFVDELFARAEGRGLIVAGQTDDPTAGAAALMLGERLGWPVLADIGSQVRLGAPHASPLRIAHADALLAASSAISETLRPNAVLHLGGRVVSKRVAAFIAESPPALYAHADPRGFRLDPHHLLTHRFEAEPEAFANDLTSLYAEPADTDFVRAWTQADAEAARALDAAFEAERRGESLSEPLVARVLSEFLPERHGLILASSLPVRLVDRFGSLGGSAPRVVTNRGASGIDGTVATASGAARGLGWPATLLIGDLALRHDLSSLPLLKSGPPVVIVCLNNDGGGIFHLLPIARHASVFEPYFTTPHGLDFAHAAAHAGLPYAAPRTLGEFADAYAGALQRGTSALIEVRTDRETTAARLAELETLALDALAS